MSIRLVRNLGKLSVDSLLPMVHLDWQERQRARLAVVVSDGRAAAIMLSRSEPMREGDVLESEDGLRVMVHAAVQPLLEIKAPTPFELTRVVYHLANRHATTMLMPHAVYIEPDPILAELVTHLGASVEQVERPFEPERGAYHGVHSHAHHHGEIDDEDRRFGNIGEELSQRAHATR